jgi:fatty-acyl-CoA synthase
VIGPALPAVRFASLGDALVAAASSRSGITFVDLHERERFLGFAEIHARAGRFAAALHASGVAAGDRVALVLPTSPEFLEALFGTIFAGAVPVPLYPPLRLGRLAEYDAATARMLELVGARLVVGDRRTRRLLGPAIERARPDLGFREAAALSAAGRCELDCGGKGDHLALIQFSSGATTDPKPVALSHRQILAQLAAITAVLRLQDAEGELGVSWLPLYHDMGLIGCLLLAVYVPGPLVLIPPEHFLARPALWLRAVARHRATLSLAPAFGYAYAAKRVRDEEAAGLDLSSWRMAGCGAEPIAPAALEGFARRFAPAGFAATSFRPCYGLAEAGLAVTFTTANRPLASVGADPGRLATTGEVVAGGQRIVSVGAPVPGFEVEIRGEDCRSLSERRVGRIFVRGPSVTVAYFGQPEATARTLVAGWLDTGDLGFVAGGELFVCGRVKDVIVIRGANHAPQEFEECTGAITGLRAGGVAAVGFLPDGEAGEALLVLAERARDGRRESDATLIAAIRRAVLERSGVAPHTVRILAPGTLPRTSSGKLRRSEAARRFLAGELAPPRAVTGTRVSLAVLRSALALARARARRGR